MRGLVEGRAEGWEPFDDYKPREERRHSPQPKTAAQEKEQAEEEHRHRQQAERNALQPARKAEHPTARWVGVRTAVNCPPAPEERGVKDRQYLCEGSSLARWTWPPTRAQATAGDWRRRVS